MLIGAYYYCLDGPWLDLTVRKSDPPIRGEYDNTKYGPVIVDQMYEMWSAGIDFVSVSWGHGERKDYGHILDAAKETGIKVTYFYESLIHWSDKRASIPAYALETILENIEIIKEDMLEDCWLKIDDRPVLMFYVTRCFKEQTDKMFREIRKAIPNVYLVADELWWDPIPDEKVEMFDSVTAYNMYLHLLPCFEENDPEKRAMSYLDSCREMMQKHADQSRRLNRPLWGTAMPGYDDFGVRPEQNHPLLSRLNGDFFRRSLKDARDSSIGQQALMICSYCEHFEDTAIEPCRSFGSTYLDIVKTFKGTVL